MGRRNTKAGETPAPVLADMTKEQLVELALEKGVDLEGGMEKEAIIERLIEADPSLSAGPADDDAPEPSEGSGQGEAGDDFNVGAIRTIQGVEMVKINDSADGWVPTIREKVEEGKPVTVVCQKRAGKTIFAKTGKPITLDANGKATVSAADGFYLSNIIINGKPEYTVE